MALSSTIAGNAGGWRAPTRLSAALFAAKATAFRLRRAAVDAAQPPAWLGRGSLAALTGIAALSRTPLWADEALAEQAMQAGKNRNLAIAALALDGLFIPKGTTFSFWRHVGPPTARRGYVQGRMLQEGCMVAAVGGGLCQLSNALYDVALQAGCGITERHPHSRVVPGSAAAAGRDATVAWNYVDLRFTPVQDLGLSVELAQGQLVVRLLSRPGEMSPPSHPKFEKEHSGLAEARSCASCGEQGCFRYEGDG